MLTATTKTRSKNSSRVLAVRPGSCGSRGRIGIRRERVAAVLSCVTAPDPKRRCAAARGGRSPRRRTGDRGLGDQDPGRAAGLHLVQPVDTFELVAQQEQVPAVGTAEHAGEARQAVSTRWVIVPPSSTRTHAPAGSSGSPVCAATSAACDQIAASASTQMPSGPSPSAHVRRPVSVPSSPMSNALRRPANDSATTSVEPSGVTTIPFGKSMSPATFRWLPSGATRWIQPGSGAPPPAKSKSAPSTNT